MRGDVEVFPAPGTESPSGWSADPTGALAEGSFPALAGLLARSETGIGFIYQALDLLAAHYHLADAVLQVDDRVAGLQMFRLQRAPVQGDQPFPVLPSRIGESERGLITEPDVVDRVTADSVAHLAEVALRLDLLSHDAGHDPLTGLLNRRSYEGSLSLAVSRSCRYGWPFALVSLDLDGFKAVNDRLGHHAGDEALRILGAEVRGVLRSGDLAARVGGDEFALIVQNVRHRHEIDPLLDRLRAALESRRPDIGLHFSVGIAYFPHDAGDAGTLAKIADTRLYAAKQGLYRSEQA